MDMEEHDDVDVYVGKRIRERRKIMGMTQQNLAAELGLSFQQVQKYERGSNRVGAGKLVQLSRALDVPVSYFFEDIEDVRQKDIETAERPVIDPHILSHAQVLAVVKSLIGIKDDKVRRKLIDLIESVYESEQALTGSN
ncbi:MAG: helix-turn-helix transcriptional regulator [Rhodothalassiaceae bacterium]